MQERQAALPAVSSQLWQDRHRAAANSPHSTRAVPNSSRPSTSAVPSSPSPSANTLTATSVRVVPTLHGAVTQSVSGSVKLAKEGQDTASKQHRMQEQASCVGREPPLVGNSSGQGLPEQQQGLSERQARAAARLSRLAKNSTTAKERSPGGQLDLHSQSKASTGRVWVGPSFSCFKTGKTREAKQLASAMKGRARRHWGRLVVPHRSLRFHSQMVPQMMASVKVKKNQGV